MPVDTANTPDLPVVEIPADRGDDFTPEGAPPVELTAEELKVIGKGPTAEGEAKADDLKVDVEDKVEAKPEEPARDDKGKFIPKARFDEVNTKAKNKVAALEGQIKQLNERLGMVEGKGPDTKELEAQLDAKSEQYGQLLADGNQVEAKAVLQDINRLNRKIGAIETSALSSAHTTESKHVDALGELVVLYKDAYPVFDDASEYYSQEKVDFVARLQGKLEATGSSPADALRESVELAVAKFSLDPEPEVAAVAAVPNKGEERKAAAVKKAIGAATAQPPTLARVGADSDKAGMGKIDVAALTYDEFERLPDSTKSRLRGDLA